MKRFQALMKSLEENCVTSTYIFQYCKDADALKVPELPTLNSINSEEAAQQSPAAITKLQPVPLPLAVSELCKELHEMEAGSDSKYASFLYCSATNQLMAMQSAASSLQRMLRKLCSRQAVCVASSSARSAEVQNVLQ